METIKKKQVMDNIQFAPIILGKLLHIGGMLQGNGNKLLMPFGLNQQQFSILFEIVKAEKVRQKDMVNRLSLERAHVSKVIKKLQNMELILVTASDDDRRSAWLTPTQKGKGLINDCMKVFNEWNNEWFSQVDMNQLSSILDNLSHLQEIFKNNIK